MKIALIVPGFSADERDWCIPALLNLAHSLADKHAVRVFALRYPYRRDVYGVRGATIHSFNGRARSGFASARLWATVIGAIAREHRRAPFDVLHAIWGSEAGLVAVLAGKRLRVPSIVSFVGGELVKLPEIGYGQDLQPRQRWMNAFVLRFADQLLGGSPDMAELARTRVPVSRRARVAALTLGVDTQIFSPRVPIPTPSNGPTLSSGSANILSVGSLIPVKDHVTLLRAFAQFASTVPNAHLNIVGNGQLESALRALAIQLNIASRVSFLGSVEHDQLPSWYRAADVFVQSSRHEVQAMATLEAAACGTAVAGTKVGMLAELARRGAATAVPPNDARALAQAMVAALDHRDALGLRACEIVQVEYNLARIREELIEIYQRISRNKDAVNITPTFVPS